MARASARRSPLFFVSGYRAHRDLHSFPTRRSSDLGTPVLGTPVGATPEILFPLSPALVFRDRKSTRLNSSHTVISYAVFCLKKKTYFEANITFPTFAPFTVAPEAAK